MTDLREYGEGELAIVITNDESLYNEYIRAETVDELKEVVKGFLYTDEQFEELVDTWESETEE